MAFKTIVIIYNPKSTGPSKQLAKNTAAELRLALSGTDIRLLPTQYAGHAEELAYDLSLAGDSPFIISSSGDGGYHEVVNGIMRAAQKGGNAVAGLLPGGNANDHYHTLHQESIVDAVLQEHIRTIDVLKLAGTREGTPVVRYAHSYVGLGITPRIGRKLTKARLNRWNEVTITLRSLISTHRTRLVVDGKEQAYRSLVCTNIGRMAKVLNFSSDSKPDDGLFELSTMEKRSRLHLLASLLHASTIGLNSSRPMKKFSFQTLRKTLLQLDGEVFTLDGGTTASVTIEPHALRCIV